MSSKPKAIQDPGLLADVFSLVLRRVAANSQYFYSRTVASTNMNATSSRAHTIVGIHFIQKQKNKAGKDMEKKAMINLVDLAGR